MNINGFELSWYSAHEYGIDESGWVWTNPETKQKSVSYKTSGGACRAQAEGSIVWIRKPNHLGTKEGGT